MNLGRRIFSWFQRSVWRVICLVTIVEIVLVANFSRSKQTSSPVQNGGHQLEQIYFGKILSDVETLKPKPYPAKVRLHGHALEEAEVVKVTLDKKNDSSRQITKSNEVAQLMENVEENRAKENEKKAREREREAQVEETKARREIGKQFLNERKGGNEMSRKMERKGRNLVFTTAGKDHNMEQWMNCEIPVDSKLSEDFCNFDIFVVYYVDDISIQINASIEKTQVSRIGKFPTLFREYYANPLLFKQYDSIFVLDDDILINGYEIQRLFDLRLNHDFWVLQCCRNDHTAVRTLWCRNNPFQYRVSNFVEVGVSMFSTEKLLTFLDEFYCGDCLASFGVDFWYMYSMGFDTYLNRRTFGKAAIVDSIACTNPIRKHSSDSSWHQLVNDGEEVFKKVRDQYSFHRFARRTFYPNGTRCRI
mmetsp:Transcript_12465/g.16168  ORF Transcript_12465/g.16168 Transcript_12465/m.16168 type:complete len:419 (-) Transcript_12465:379-1635(-)